LLNKTFVSYRRKFPDIGPIPFSDEFEVWWDLLITFHNAFTAEFVGERIMKIDQHYGQL